MSIGRNDLCPCGSGKKYKKCCLNKNTGFTKNLNAEILKTSHSVFNNIESNTQNIAEIIKEYDYRDIVKAVFCINLWRRNRSALELGLTLNAAILSVQKFGVQHIHTYGELKIFYEKIAIYMQITPYDDYIIDDYGEVFLNHAGKSYPVIIGTGHQQVYGALRYLQTLVTLSKRDSELLTILEYLKTIIDFTQYTNLPNSREEIVHELPTENFWDTVKDLFNNSLFQAQITAVYQIMGHQFGPIEFRHFVKYQNEVLPLFNSSILVDYYKILSYSVTPDIRKKHIPQTIHSLIENSFNFSPNTPNRVLLSPVIFDTEQRYNQISNGILFAGYGHNTVIIAIDDTTPNNHNVIKKIDKLKSENSLNIIEPYQRENFNGKCGFEVRKDCEIIYILVDPFTDITSHALWTEEKNESYFKCTALDILYILGFSEDINELVDFIRYNDDERAEIFSFGGKNNLFFTWKNTNRYIYLPELLNLKEYH